MHWKIQISFGMLSDEAIFIAMAVSIDTSHYWSPVNPHQYREVVNHCWNFHVWIEICNGLKVISSHFF